MTATDFFRGTVFQPEVPFGRTPNADPRNPPTRVNRAIWKVGKASAAASILAASALLVGVMDATASEVVISARTIARTCPSPELTPEVIALYRQTAEADRHLANLDLSSYSSELRAEDE